MAQQKSAYGTTVELMCENPNLPIEKLYEKLKERKINTETKKPAILTGVNQVRKIYELLKENGHVK